MKRRELITLLGGVAFSWPLAVRAQQGGMRTIGYLSPRSADTEVEVLTAFRRGLRETGFIEGKNIAIEYRWAEGHYDQLSALAAELANKQVAAIATTGGPHPVRAVRVATQAIPIVFASGSDPVRDGLVESLNRPGGNTTGVHNFTTQLGPKRLEVLRELVPAARLIGFIIHPTSEQSEAQVKEIEETGRGLGQQLLVLPGGTEAEIDGAFTTLVQRRAGALLISADTYFQVRRAQLIALAARHAIPTMYEWPEFVKAGGLIAYAPVRTDTSVQLGIYVGRILNGAKPEELPVVQPTKFELLINLNTAKALGLTVPPSLLARADEVIE